MKALLQFGTLLGFLAAFGCSSSQDPAAGDPGSSSDEIIGGTADTGHPYVVGIGNSSGAFCTGTVVSKRTVITAGHCYRDGITKVFLGSQILHGAQTIAVERAVRDPQFATAGMGITHDLTMVKLAADAPVQPVPLLRETLGNSPDYVGPNFTFVGYGRSSSWGGFGTKRVATWPILTVGPAHVGGTPRDIDATMFYYNVPHMSACHGDSGGPAFYVRDGVEHLAGATSFGNPYCSSDGVQQRTDAPAIAGFIQRTIDEFEANDACRSDGTCNESCNTDGQVRDADCADQHCGADGVCSQACQSDPDCAANP